MKTKQHLFYIILTFLVFIVIIGITQSKQPDVVATEPIDAAEWVFQKTEFTSDQCPIYKIINLDDTNKKAFFLLNLRAEEKILLDQCKDSLNLLTNFFDEKK